MSLLSSAERVKVVMTSIVKTLSYSLNCAYDLAKLMNKNCSSYSAGQTGIYGHNTYITSHDKKLYIHETHESIPDSVKPVFERENTFLICG